MTRSTAQLDLLLIVRTPAGERRAVSVHIAPDRSASELANRLAGHLGLDSASLGLHLPGRTVSVHGSADVGGLGLRMGDELWLVRSDHHELPSPPTSNSPWELAVVSGPLAGRRFPLRIGPQTLGRAAEADLRLADGAVSRSHLSLTADNESVILSPASRLARVYQDGRPIRCAHRAGSDDLFEVGHELLTVRAGEAPMERPSRLLGGRVQFNRPPAGPSPPLSFDFKLQSPPAEPARLRVPIAAAVTPLFVGGAIWLATRNVVGLLFALATPLMAIAPALEDLVVGRWRRRRQARRYQKLIDEAGEALRGLRERETRMRREQAPDAAELETRARLVLPTLWERRPDRPGFLRLRMGWGDIPSSANVQMPEGGRSDLRDAAVAAASRTAVLAAVPITVDLLEVGSLGLAGPPEVVDGAARWLIIQATALHSPRELAVAAFLSRRAAEDSQGLRSLTPTCLWWLRRQRPRVGWHWLCSSSLRTAHRDTDQARRPCLSWCTR